MHHSLCFLAIALDPKIEIEIMGSYRRGAEDSGDVDMLLTRDTSDGFSHAGKLTLLLASRCSLFKEFCRN